MSGLWDIVVGYKKDIEFTLNNNYHLRYPILIIQNYIIKNSLRR